MPRILRSTTAARIAAQKASAVKEAEVNMVEAESVSSADHLFSSDDDNTKEVHLSEEEINKYIEKFEKYTEKDAVILSDDISGKGRKGLDLPPEVVDKFVKDGTLIPVTEAEGGKLVGYTMSDVVRSELEIRENAAQMFANKTHAIARDLTMIDNPDALGNPDEPDKLYVSDNAFDNTMENYTKLNEEQKRAVFRATRGEGIGVLIGPPGTGKTTTGVAIIDVYKAQGYDIIGVANDNVVVQDLKTRANLETAETAAKLVKLLETGSIQLTAKTLLAADEGSKIPAKYMGPILEHMNRAGAKALIMGDDKQMSSIDRPAGFDWLAKNYTIGRLEKTYRANSLDQEAVFKSLNKNDFESAVKTIAKGDGLVIRKDRDDAKKALAREMIKSDTSPQDKIAIVPTHQDVAYVNAAMRNSLKAKGELQNGIWIGIKYQRNDRIYEAKREFAVGDRVAFKTNNKELGLYNGRLGTIEKIDGKNFTILEDGKGPEKERRKTVNTEEYSGLEIGYAATGHSVQGKEWSEVYYHHIKAPFITEQTVRVAMTRHQKKLMVFSSKTEFPDTSHGKIAETMRHTSEHKAASTYHIDPSKVGDTDLAEGIQRLNLTRENEKVPVKILGPKEFHPGKVNVRRDDNEYESTPATETAIFDVRVHRGVKALRTKALDKDAKSLVGVDAIFKAETNLKFSDPKRDLQDRTDENWAKKLTTPAVVVAATPPAKEKPRENPFAAYAGKTTTTLPNTFSFGASKSTEATTSTTSFNASSFSTDSFSFGAKTPRGLSERGHDRRPSVEL